MNRSGRLICLAIALTLALPLDACGSAQSRKAAYVQHGREYLAAANYDKARVEFRNAAQIDPKDAEVSYLLGEVAEKTGNVRDAVALYQAAINENPKLAEARAALARDYVYGGLMDRAMSLIEPGLAAEPNNAELLTARGAARLRLGDAAGALSDAEAAVQRAPDDIYAIQLLASLYRQKGDLDKAIAVVQAALQRTPKSADLHLILADLDSRNKDVTGAEEQMHEVISLEPKELPHRYELARYLLQQKDVDAAEQVVREAVSSAPDNADAKLMLINFLAAQRGPERAAAEAEQMLAREPGNDSLKLALGQYFVRAGNAPRAEAIYKSAVEHAGKKPDGLLARNLLAALLLARGDVGGATTLVDEVLKENARDNSALVIRADIALAKGDAPASIADLRAVLRDQPNSVPIMRALARSYTQNGEPDLAEEAVRQAVQLAPKDPGSRMDLAQALIRSNKLDEALPLLEQLTKDEPMNVQVQQVLFRVQAAQQRYEDARATAVGIQKTEPKSGAGLYLAGLIDEAEHKDADAARDYEQALELQPDAVEPLAALTRLDIRLKQPARAMQRVDAVIAKFPKDAAALNLKAELFAAQAQYPSAIKAYQDTIQAVPGAVAAYHGLAQAQHLAKLDDDAIRTLQQGLDKTHDSQELVSDLSRLYEGLGKVDDAIALYNGILTKNPQSVFALNNLAMLLVTFKSDPASIGRAQKLADQLTAYSVVEVVDTRGWVKFKSGDFHAAEALLQQAVDKAPDSPMFHYHLGMAQLRSGEPQTAAQNLETALQSPQQFVGIDEARAALAQLKKGPSAG